MVHVPHLKVHVNQTMTTNQSGVYIKSYQTKEFIHLLPGHFSVKSMLIYFVEVHKHEWKNINYAHVDTNKVYMVQKRLPVTVTEI